MIPSPFSIQPYLKIIIPISVLEVNKARPREMQKDMPKVTQPIDRDGLGQPDLGADSL